MVTQYGMSDRFGLMGLESIENRYLDGRAVLNCGDATAAEIDNEVMKILKECYQRAEDLLAGNRDVLDKIAEFLIEKETITGKEFMEIYKKVKENVNVDSLDNSKETVSIEDKMEAELKQEDITRIDFTE